MTSQIESSLFKSMNSDGFCEYTPMQSLWSGYGELARIRLNGLDYESFILKHVHIPDNLIHPRNWGGEQSHLRKLKSYSVELEFYQRFADRTNEACYVPRMLWSYQVGQEFGLLLEDLSRSDYSVAWPDGNAKGGFTENHLKACIQWLANFHAAFLGEFPEGLWHIGTYWHLDTRPDELEALDDMSLKSVAHLIDQKLNQCKFKTLVHGDAKLANFCFNHSGSKVAGVDFQYVGGGCGLKDLAYFLGSCLSESECERREQELLDYYFTCLESAFKHNPNYSDPIGITALIRADWESLYAFAWADFHRFLKGWSPGHWKINSYSEKMCRKVIAKLS